MYVYINLYTSKKTFVYVYIFIHLYLSYLGAFSEAKPSRESLQRQENKGIYVPKMKQWIEKATCSYIFYLDC
jgi:hypothetical protein